MAEPNTVGWLADRVLTTLDGSRRGRQTTLESAVTATDTQVTFTDALTALSAGTYLSIGRERVYVSDVTPQQRGATVRRGERSTSAAAHAAGTTIWVGPMFPRDQLIDVINDEIRSWPEGVFAVDSAELTEGGMLTGQAATRATSILALYGYNPDRTRVWFPSSVRATLFRLPGRAPEVVFEDLLPSYDTVTVVYAASLPDVPLTEAMPLASLGITRSMVDIIVFGAAARLAPQVAFDQALLTSRAVPQPAEQAPDNAALQFAQWCQQQRDRRLAEEIGRLRTLYPLRRS